MKQNEICFWSCVVDSQCIRVISMICREVLRKQEIDIQNEWRIYASIIRLLMHECNLEEIISMILPFPTFCIAIHTREIMSVTRIQDWESANSNANSSQDRGKVRGCLTVRNHLLGTQIGCGVRELVSNHFLNLLDSHSFYDKCMKRRGRDY